MVRPVYKHGSRRQAVMRVWGWTEDANCRLNRRRSGPQSSSLVFQRSPSMPASIDPMYAVLVPTVLVAGFVRGFSGFGGPMVMLPVFGFYFPPATTIWLVMWVDVFVNLQLVPEARHHASRQMVLPLILGSMLTIPIGVAALFFFDAAIMKKVISFSILVAATVLLAGWRFKRETGQRSAFAAGAISGVILGATYIAVATALFLQSARQTALESRANFITWGFLSTLVMMAILAWSRPPQIGNWQPIAALTPIYFVGAAVGTRFHHRADPRRARIGVLLLIIVIAISGLLR